MLIPKKNRLAIYRFLFSEGVIVCKKDYALAKHPHLEVPNIHVCKAMQSMKSMEPALVKETFSWQWYYYSLTDEGIAYLQNYLHVSEDTKPKTCMKDDKVLPPLAREPEQGGFQGKGRGGYRDGGSGFRGRGRGGFRGRGRD